MNNLAFGVFFCFGIDEVVGRGVVGFSKLPFYRKHG